MDALAVQRKESDKSAKAAAMLTPEPQTEATQEKGAALGVPLFLNGARRSAAAPTPPKVNVQRQPTSNSREPELLLPGMHGNVDIQRQASEEEEEEELVQAKPSIGRPDDEYERQADSVSAHVMRMPSSTAEQEEEKASGTLQAKPITPLYIQRLCSNCREEQPVPAGTQPRLQTKRDQQSTEPATPKLTEVLNTPGSGTALPSELQSRAGTALGSDLSGVRVHADSKAQQAAASINARAFTHGNHIYLGKGESSHDMKLMAHEATHVVQQGAAPASAEAGTESSRQPRGHADQIEAEEGENAGNDQATEAAEATQKLEEGAEATQSESSERQSQQTETQAQAAPAAEASSATESQQAEGEAQAAEEAPETASAEQGAQAAQATEAESVAAGVDTQSATPETGEAAGDRPEGEDGAAVTLGRISAAPETALKPHVTAQAESINNHTLATEIQITELAEQRRQQVSLQCDAARSGMLSVVEGHIALAQQFIAAQQQQVSAVTASALATTQAALLGTLAAMEVHSGVLAASISAIVQSAAISAQASVAGIAGQISSLINTIPLPNLPGVAQARAAAASLVNRAAGMVNNMLGMVLNLIRRGLSGAMNMLSHLLRSFRRVVERTFQKISRIIQRTVQSLFRTLSRVLNLLVSVLRRALYGAIIPTLVRVEQSVIRAITEQEQQSLEELRSNRQQHLEALAAALSLEGGEGTATETTSMADWITSVHAIGQSALDNNHAILLSFLEQTGSFFALLITTLRSVTAQIIQAIVSRVAQMMSALINMVARLLQNIMQTVAAVITFLQRLMQRFLAMLRRIVEFVRRVVQSPVDWLIGLARRTLARIREMVSRFVRRLLGGGGGAPNWAPSPAPVPIPVPAPPVPEPVPTPVPAPVPTPTPTPTPTPAPTPGEIAIVIIIIVVLIILLILLYLLYKWLTRPRLPKPPKPPKKPSGNEYDPGDPYNIRYSVPLEKNNIQASPGEKMIFGVEASDKDRLRPIGTAAWTDIDPGPGPFEIEYQVDRDADFVTAGSGTRRHIDPTLQSRNIYLFIENTWAGRTITVSATIKDKALPAAPPDIGTTRDADHIITWTIVGRANPCPTGLSRVAGPGQVWTPAPGIYTYEATPEINPPGRPNYENQTVLESFANTKANGFTMADLKPAWKSANPTLNTPDKVANFLYGVSNNGTFVFNNQDRIRDRHSGFGTTDPFLAASLARASGVGYQKDQTYSCGTANIGQCLIERRYSTTTGIRVRKSSP